MTVTTTNWKASIFAIMLGSLGLGTSLPAVTITPGATDTVILFEAELGNFDNSALDPTTGWDINAVDGVNFPIPSGTSNGSYIVATEDTQGLDDPHNNASYDIDFQQVGFYSIYVRAAWTAEDLFGDDNGTPESRSGHDSLFWGPTSAVPDGTNISIDGDGRANNIGRGWVGPNGTPPDDRDAITNSDWRWLHIFDPPSSTGLSGISGHGGPLPVLSFGELTFRLGTREEGLMIDRVALVYQTNQDTITDAYLNALPNSPVAGAIPEPSSAFLALSFAVGALLKKRD